MATKLTKDVTRETDIMLEDKPVSVTLSPDNDGVLKFRVKGARQSLEISLRKVLGIVSDIANIPRTPVVVNEPTGASGNLVDLSRLESRLMIDGSGVMTPAVKGALFEIIREMREEMHEDAGLPPVYRGTKAARQKSMRRDSDD